MITLSLTNEFTFNTSDGAEFSGTFRELNLKEEKEFKDLAQLSIKLATKVDKIIKKMSKNEKRIAFFEAKNDFDEADKLEKKNEALAEEIRALSEEHKPNEQVNNTLRKRFNLCLGGDNREAIIKIAEEIGYKPVFDVIKKAIIEGKQKS